MQKYLKYIPYLVCIILGIALCRSCYVTRDVREEMRAIKAENKALMAKIETIKEENSILLKEADVYAHKADSLENEVIKAKKTKIKLVEKVKYIKPSNDTLQDLIALNEVNDTIIRGLEAIIVEKDSIIWKYNLVTQNDRIIIKGLEDMLAERNKQLEAYSKEILKQKNEKVI